jgi:GntR family transcriptional regulator/MocR family aminotransferase
MADNGERLFRKAPAKGCAVLRNAIADYLLRYRGMVAQPDRIIIGSGAEQLYETTVKIIGRDKVFGIEEPSYAQIRAVYEDMGIDVCGLKMGEDGIDSRALTDNRFDVLHVTPFNSYPSGVTASVSKRQEYLLWAREQGKYIVEDDFDSEFFMPGQPIESLYSMDTCGKVIYINTFSKSLSPAMRLGYMILPCALMEEYERKQGHFSCTVPVLDQHVLAEFISNGSFERHLNRMRRKLKK